MPRDGSGVYSIPLGTDGVSDQTIESTKYNVSVHDFETDANTSRPIVAGGTGATSAAGARTNLQAEIAAQQVTNYDSQVWETGSFWSLTSATGSPVAGHTYAGIVVVANNDPTYVTLRAVDLTTGDTYTRLRSGGAWGAWTSEQGTYDARYINMTGDTMTGDLTIAKAAPVLALTRPDATSQCGLLGYVGANLHWKLILGTASANDDFAIQRYDNSGTSLGTPFALSRSDGSAIFSGGVTFAGGTAINASGDYTNTAAGTHYIGATNAGGTLNFLAGDGATVRMVMGVGGVGIGAAPATTPGFSNTIVGHNFNINGTEYHNAAAGPTVSIGANADGFLVPFYRSGTLVGSITITTTATAYNVSSDERLKTDLQEFSAGKIIDDTRVYSFAWKSGAPVDRSYGVSAQQANEVYPQAVFHDEKTDWWGIDYSKYVPILLQELKALRARVAQLEAGLASKPA